MSEELNAGIKHLLMLEDAVYERYEAFLAEIIGDTCQELAHLLEEENVPTAYLYMVKKVVVKRFNRRKNEGMKAMSAAESRVEYQADDFEEFRSSIQAYVEKKHGLTRPQKGKAVWL